MNPALGWLVALATCYPWLLAGDLLGDLTASWHLVVFLPGAVLVTPILHLRTWQVVALAGCVGLAYEARRPIPPGLFALGLMVLSVLAVTWRDRLRSKPSWLAPATLNTLACALALPASLPVTGTWDWSEWLWSLPVQLVVAGAAAAVLHRPISAFQSRLLERSGLPEIREP